ncbi:MAG: hypothetical protein ABEJ72_05790, partial [Candidatus Aenigmatarchaeota archaeon]
MDEDRLKEWVEQKLEKGIDPERVKKSLEETGHDPSIVDRVQDPFDSLDEAVEKEEQEEKQDAPFDDE